MAKQLTLAEAQRKMKAAEIDARRAIYIVKDDLDRDVGKGFLALQPAVAAFNDVLATSVADKDQLELKIGEVATGLPQRKLWALLASGGGFARLTTIFGSDYAGDDDGE